MILLYTSSSKENMILIQAEIEMIRTCISQSNNDKEQYNNIRVECVNGVIYHGYADAPIQFLEEYARKLLLNY